MFQHKTILAFIGAREGSKGLKNKNIIDLAGKPLIQWTIESALGSQYIDRIIVSTDGQKIAELAKKNGADVPFLRPKKLAGDEALLDVSIQHCVEWLQKNENIEYDYIVLLQPTSPLRTYKHIDEAIKYFFENSKNPDDILSTVVPAPPKVGWLMKKNKDGYVEFSLGVKEKDHCRQNLPQYYFYNGFFFMGNTNAMQYIGSNMSKILPYFIDDVLGLDIDSAEDLEKAKKILETYECK